MQPLDQTVLATAPPVPRRSALAEGALSRWRAPLSILALLSLPFLLPSQALAVNVLIYGLYAVGYNLLYGYTGLLSFGHAAFFGTGAYVTGIAIGTYGLQPLAAMGLAVAAAGVLALAIGAVSIRSRGIYFAMVTLALAQLVYYAALQASGWTGGENGLRGFTVARMGFGPVAFDILNPLTKYFVVLAFVGAALMMISRILASPFGAVIEAIRENETRARACGIDVERTKLLAFVLSGLFCGLAGALFAIHLSIVPLDSLAYHTSGMAVVMTLVGGAGTFFGPFVGALAVLVLEDALSLWTPHWQLALGTVFILFVLFLPRGLWGSALTRLAALRGGP
ncbi:branched-chain amino acid ABC transporter permease [Methylobacterium sp. J-067]|jgi:branched-chain amino acid transport system permease protein|uniref:branched-chain amino acid ABC transporter permease n=1 Tax=Methylobacterium sp. J-067 TaxID=2836648 RepID=UPI001FBBED57|nr:branched-chain amino acid ABC transporter permease [Methylobacterium sp. J-067]MCJ2026941.1 branched-chain amino acid ABC transporter permease [Methylobacterium sp. J-067]